MEPSIPQSRVKRLFTPWRTAIACASLVERPSFKLRAAAALAAAGLRKTTGAELFGRQSSGEPVQRGSVGAEGVRPIEARAAADVEGSETVGDASGCEVAGAAEDCDVAGAAVDAAACGCETGAD